MAEHNSVPPFRPAAAVGTTLREHVLTGMQAAPGATGYARSLAAPVVARDDLRHYAARKSYTLEEAMPNRSPLAVLLPALLCCTVAAPVAAQTSYPDRPIRVIVPLAPGGGSDYTARYIGLRLADRVGQAVVVDNRPAASGIVGTELVAKAVPDGYTLLLAYSTHAQSAKLFTTLPDRKSTRLNSSHT